MLFEIIILILFIYLCKLYKINLIRIKDIIKRSFLFISMFLFIDAGNVLNFISLLVLFLIIRYLYYILSCEKDILIIGNNDNINYFSVFNKFNIKVGKVKYSKKYISGYDIIIYNSASNFFEEVYLNKKTLIFISVSFDNLIYFNSYKNLFVFEDKVYYCFDKFCLNKLDKIIKRLFDVIMSLILIFIFSLLMIIIVILIKINSKGSILYKQERETINNKKFIMYKFRSMYVGSDQLVELVKVNDERITFIGGFLRKYKLDELPQLFNVLKGDMSMVGPRPERTYFIDKYKNVPYYNIRHNVKSGLCGLSHVYGGYYTEVLNRYIYDLLYIKNYSVFLDIKILIDTFFVVLFGR